jgi:uncharacterized membrane protein YagU involved in acid resistance
MNARNILHGIYGGLAGGLVFGIMMGMMGMLPMIGKMIGAPNAIAGSALHLINSAIIGAAFAVIVSRLSTGNGTRHSTASLVHGLLYGGFWWLLGPLTLMPLFMGMGLGVNWNLTAATNMLPSLFGHLIYGVILGITYGRLEARSTEAAGETAAG